MNNIIIKATVEHIVYSNPDTGYVICDVTSQEEGSFCAVGTMPTLTEGDNVELTGNWTVHQTYGEQFKVELYNTIMPSDEAAILKYLSSGIIKGVRASTAKKLFDKFGTDVFDVLMTDTKSVAAIKGIGAKKAETICNSFREQRAVQNIIMFLQQYNISPATAVKIHNIFGAGAIEKIKDNPYSLADKIDGISFRTADTIAFNLGMPKNSRRRIKCGMVYFLKEAAYSNGNVYMPKDLISEHTAYQLTVNQDEVTAAMQELIAERTLMPDKIDKHDVVYLYNFYHDEKYIAARLVSMGSHPVGPKYTMPENEAAEKIAEFETNHDIKLAFEQHDAVITALSQGCMVLTGGPGTGKTTTINTVISLLEDMKLKIALAAPTGRAAKRMSQITGREAKTVHRLLGAQMSGGGHVFSHNEDYPLNEDVIILDEVSMIDTPLMAAFLRAVKPGARVIFSGDSDQLPSVGPGNVLHDIIESGVIPVIRLTHIFRQSEKSLIIVNAHSINRGEMPELNNHQNDFFFMKRANPQASADTILTLYTKRLPDAYNINSVNDIQVLSPTRKGMTGTNELNKLLQEKVNPPAPHKREHKSGSTIFREGDKVMQIKNNYDMPYTCEDGEKGTGIYNGDMGIINTIHTESKYMIIRFDDGKIIEYPFTGLDELDLSYAITVHKSQGSEFPYVIMPVCAYIEMLMSRNLLYTAITRAKSMVILVGSEDIIYRMVRNTSYTKRFTGLSERMVNYDTERTKPQEKS